MPPFAASILFYVFVFWALRRMERGEERLGLDVWIPTAWIILIGTKSLAYWIAGPALQQALFVEDTGPPYDAIAFFGLIFLGLIALSRKPVDWRTLFAENPILVAFYAYLFISVFWSDYPFVAFKRYVKEVGNLVMILVMLVQPNSVASIRRGFLRCTMIFIPISILLIKYYGEIGRYYNPWTGEVGLCGATTSKNELGRLAMWSFMFLVWHLQACPRHKSIGRWLWANCHYLFVAGMCVWLLLKANSATSLGCFLAGLLLFLALRGRGKILVPKLMIAGVAGFLVLSLLFFTVPEIRGEIATHFGRHSDLTERTDVWAGCLNAGTNPIIGEGFFSFWMTARGFQLGEVLRVTEAHNGYLETYLNTGIIGVALLIGVILHAARNVKRLVIAGSPLGVLFTVMLWIALIYNNTEAAYNDNNIIGFIFLLVAIRRSSNESPSIHITSESEQFSTAASYDPA
ncbi:MAG TPA: O-antigen ligase family protein [Candidatus Didemnitutus sp.]|jgi:O-antigen ligase